MYDFLLIHHCNYLVYVCELFDVE